jgi:hypothetical protein
VFFKQRGSARGVSPLRSSVFPLLRAQEFLREQLGLGSGCVGSLLFHGFTESLLLMRDRILRVIDLGISGHGRWCHQPVRTIDSANDIRFDGMLDIMSGLHGIVCRTARILNGSVGVSLHDVCLAIVVVVPAAYAKQSGTRNHH